MARSGVPAPFKQCTRLPMESFGENLESFPSVCHKLWHWKTKRQETGTLRLRQPPHPRQSMRNCGGIRTVLRPSRQLRFKALNLISGTDTSLLEPCNLIRSDVAFSAAVPRIANSPLTGFPKNVTRSGIDAARLPEPQERGNPAWSQGLSPGPFTR